MVDKVVHFPADVGIDGEVRPMCGLNTSKFTANRIMVAVTCKRCRKMSGRRDFARLVALAKRT